MRKEINKRFQYLAEELLEKEQPQPKVLKAPKKAKVETPVEERKNTPQIKTERSVSPIRQRIIERRSLAKDEALARIKESMVRPGEIRREIRKEDRGSFDSVVIILVAICFFGLIGFVLAGMFFDLGTSDQVEQIK